MEILEGGKMKEEKKKKKSYGDFSVMMNKVPGVLGLSKSKTIIAVAGSLKDYASFFKAIRKEKEIQIKFGDVVINFHELSQEDIKTAKKNIEDKMLKEKLKL